MINFRKKSHEANQFKNQSQVIDYRVVTPQQKPCETKNVMYKFLGIFLAGWLLLFSSCSSNEGGEEVKEELKKANAKDFSFSLLSVNTKEVSVEKIKSILKNPAGWTIKSLKIDDPSFAEVTGTSVKDFKIKIKKAGEFSFSVTLQKTGYEDFVLKGVKIKATFLADAKDFSFKLLELTGAKEVTIETIKKNLTSPTGWTIKSITIADGFKDFAEVTGTSVKDFKIKIKKAGEFSFSITLQKTGWADFVLKGNIKAAKFTATASGFSFPELPVNAKEIPIAKIESNLKKPAGWTIRSIAVADSSFGDVTGSGSSQKIVLKKGGGTFVINITLQKTGFEDFVLKGNIKAANLKADAKDFSFPELPVNTKEIPFATIENNLTKPAGWTIKSLTIADSSFGDVTGSGSSQKVVLKKGGGTFAINITLEKAGYADYVLKGNIKAANLTATASDFGFPELPVNTKEIPLATIESNVTKPTGWTIKSLTVDDSSFGYVTGAGSSQKIVLKKGGAFGVTITLQKTGWVDFVLKGNIKAANLKADAKDFSFPLLSVNAKEIPIATIKSNVTKPTGWTIKSITVDNPTYAEKENQKIKIKAPTTYVPRTFTVSITLGGKTGWADYTLSGNIKADHSVWVLVFDKAKKTITGVKDRTITTINIPSEIDGAAVTAIRHGVFSGYTLLSSVTIPDSVTTIGANAFYGCTSLTSVAIPNSVTIIASGLFTDCTSLTSVTIPDKVTSIGRYVFTGCISLTSITIPNSVTSIGENAFKYCSALTSVTIPDKIASIKIGTFYNCTSLTSVKIGSSVTSIGENAFNYCSALTSVTIPDKVTSVGKNAFKNCTSLTSVKIGSSVISIGEEAFENCVALSSINIPDKVNSIKNEAFAACPKLVAKIQQTNPGNITLGRSVFGTLGSFIKRIDVPNANVATYKAAAGWSMYAKIINGY